MTTDGAIEHRAARRARIGVAMLFLTNGALFANLLPRYPEVKADLGLSNAQYGLAVAAFPAGALIAGLAAGVLIRRYRSSRVAVAGTLLTSVGCCWPASLRTGCCSRRPCSSVARWTPSPTWRRTRTGYVCSGATAGRSSTPFTRSGVSELCSAG